MGLFDLFKKTRKRSSISAEVSKNIEYEWEQINMLISQKGPSQLRQALIKADKSLDSALKEVVPGQTMGERLKEAKDEFDYRVYDKIWKAHKMRNSLVHEAGYDPPHHMITSAIEDLKAGVQKLGVRV